MDLCGIIVNHKKFGDGKIISHTEKYLVIKFPERDVRFVFPDSINTFIFIKDSVISARVNSIIEKQKAEEESMQNNHPTVNSLLNRQIIHKADLLRKSIEQVDVVKTIFEQRSINHLVHFTRIDNLPSILKHGLVPVSLQKEMMVSSVHNDDQRIDQQLNSTSFSIEFPNYKLFSKFRMGKYSEAKWVVLLIDKSILFSKQHVISYCYTNASHVYWHCNNYLQLCDAVSLGNMFREKIQTRDNCLVLRSELQIENNFTTDPQAEILISDIVDPKYIKSIIYQNHVDYNESINNIEKEIVMKHNFEVRPQYFAPRSDYRFWQKENRDGY